MTRLFSDTSSDVEEKLVEGYRQMSAAEKLRKVVSLNEALDTLARARLRRTYGDDLSEREIKLRLAALRLDRETMRTVFNWDPEEHGL